jgi:rRNA-processing protein FCF1
MRTFESMKLGVAPIIVTDDWILPKGPKWNDFSIFIKENNIRDLEKIAESHSDSYKEMGQKARKAFEEYFAEDVYFNYVIDNCLDIMSKQLIPEVIYWKLNPLIILTKKLRQKLRQQKFKKI